VTRKPWNTVVACLLAACASSPPSEPVPDPSEQVQHPVVVARADAPAVGDSCQIEDFTPSLLEPSAPVTTPTEEGQPSESEERTAAPQPPPLVGVDSYRLPPGELYCLAPGGAYPSGYVTANCASDTDCRAAACDGSLCRTDCDQDADCAAPSKCEPANCAGLKFCICLACSTGMAPPQR
jgi:hypothetical protein